jgi:hypothetical protein
MLISSIHLYVMHSSLQTLYTPVCYAQLSTNTLHNDYTPILIGPGPSYNRDDGIPGISPRSAITACISGVYCLSSEGCYSSGGGARCKVEGAERLIEAFRGLGLGGSACEGVSL